MTNDVDTDDADFTPEELEEHKLDADVARATTVLLESGHRELAVAVLRMSEKWTRSRLAEVTAELRRRGIEFTEDE